ncbi:MAG: DUF2235 domain-containing protein [Gammaproteobacteria bacterium]|nr:DUF2235 domain-containing protein [Gammaproteobacteria bacterium]
MSKRIVICADGTWSKPEKNLQEDFPTNVLRLARAIKPVAKNNIAQQVFYDWGIGSYHDETLAGITGKGLNKNIMDDYRYIVQNFSNGDEIYLFGFSRGAYTIRALCGLINNCGILKRPDAALIQRAFDLYKTSGEAHSPSGSKSIAFRKKHSHPSCQIHFVGVWDTVGAMGIPISFLGLFDDKDEFYDTKIGKNISIARHALAIDEHREDFEPTVWNKNKHNNLQQVWFAGAHSNIGGSYKPDRNGAVLSDNALAWLIKEAEAAGLSVELHLKNTITKSPTATLHKSRVKFFKLKKKYLRNIDHGQGDILIHDSVKTRWDKDKSYRPTNLKKYIKTNGWPAKLIK